MTATEVYGVLLKAGIRPFLEAGALKLAAVGDLSPELRRLAADHKQALIGLLSAMAEGQGFALARAAADAAAALSDSQRAILRAVQDRGTGGTYNLCGTYEIEGAIDARALDLALRGLLVRHPHLRWRIEVDDRGGFTPVCGVLPDSVLGVIECEESASEDFVANEFGREFDLQRESPFRAFLLRTPARTLLVLNMHHIAVDGWSVGLLLQALRAGLSGDAQPAEAWRFEDYVHSAGSERNERRVRTQLEYWHERLRDLPESSPLPYDRTARKRAWSGRRRVLAGRDLAALGNATHAATAFEIALAAFAASVALWSGSRCPLIAVPAANRRGEGLEDVVGCLVNVLPVRCDIEPSSALDRLVAGVRDALRDALHHQEAPLIRILESVEARTGGADALLRMSFAQDNVAPGPVDIGPCRLLPRAAPAIVSKYDLSGFLADGTDGHTLTIEYSDERFDAESIEAFVDLLASVLVAIDEAPQTRFEDLLVSIATARPADVFADPPADVPPAGLPPTAMALFERACAQWPERDAVLADGMRASFTDLDRRSDAIAFALRDAGVLPADRVAVLLDRGVDYPAAILGAWKVGAAYLPMDKRNPWARTQTILADCRPRALLLDVDADREDLRERLLAAVPGAAAIRIDTLASPSAPFQRQPIGTDGPAYVIYTSGSTGTPKGVQIGHAALAHFADAMQPFVARAAGPGPGPATWAMCASFAFDASLQGLCHLFSGGTLYLVSDREKADPHALKVALVRNAARVLDSTPSLLSEALEICGDALPGLFVGGEPIGQALWDRIGDLAAARGCVAYNAYGPTECTVNASLAPILPGTASNIGRALGRVVLRVVDDALRPVPPGVEGELLIGGAGLATAYLGDPERTAARFVSYGDACTTAQRMYRSGDRVRMRMDGALRYLGRIDGQVKVGGYRIQLEEIAAALDALPGVRASHVALVCDARGRERIRAWVAANAAVVGSPAEVRRALSALLPVYMVPASIQLVECIPRTTNGKVDTDALRLMATPDPVAAVSDAARGHSHWLHEAIAEVLGSGPFDENLGFTEIGGDSMDAIRISRSVRERHGVVLHPHDLIEAPDIASIADMLSETRSSSRAPVQERNPGTEIYL